MHSSSTSAWIVRVGQSSFPSCRRQIRARSIENKMNVGVLCYGRSSSTLTSPSPSPAPPESFEKKKKEDHSDSTEGGDHWNTKNVPLGFVGHNFPDFIENWNRKTFRKIGYGLTGTTAIVAGVSALLCDTTTSTLSAGAISFIPAGILAGLTAGYWKVGLNDIKQTNHAVRRNYPVLGNIRYILETIRPELRQYIVESDQDGKPFDRMHRAQVYQRAKNVDDTLPFGTRRDLYAINAEWACHSMFPKSVHAETAARHLIGTAEYGTTKLYSASVYNISAMSYGAISENAILALNAGAKYGHFYHNTGEGGVSSYHRKGGGDIVWNVGTGYFGCGSGTSKRIFEPAIFQETLDECEGRVKMIEIKLSQGAKPGHGGLLPKAKITKDIADARKLDFPAIADCHSPATHSAFRNTTELVEFIGKVRELSGGLPVGIKMCVGQPGDFASLCKSIHEVGNGPDFITIDGAEGGTGASPREFSNSIGLPLEEGLVLARNMLVGANLRGKTKLIASGKIMSGFALTRTIALGADITNAARGFMFSLGCIQALKCNTNHCPTGITTQDKELMYGLDPQDKSVRVYNFHAKTVKAACEILGAMGYESFSEVTADDIMRRVKTNEVRTLSEHFPEVVPGCLLEGKAPPRLQSAWDGYPLANKGNLASKSVTSSKRWIY